MRWPPTSTIIHVELQADHPTLYPAKIRHYTRVVIDNPGPIPVHGLVPGVEGCLFLGRVALTDDAVDRLGGPLGTNAWMDRRTG